MSKIRSLTLISLKTPNSSLAAYNATCTGIVLQLACSAVSPSSLPSFRDISNKDVCLLNLIDLNGPLEDDLNM